ncbi:MAG: UDP-3-O-(3-hydroxymyristoyl)glucosamine N-acyltransferase [Bacteroidales bacterium]|jgi:UDP-3-O-[3-hydroxymyristoyl] glucosamine N-acyltransferase|nr:UDP-3-O-(3-hydroxymyristoyl)glucosamine N-acyltransferase [Bacteroidales bacterium]MBO7379897.1 UDP-3-O-(3-hydroxymyristoyl)glucosamine N-acyltransferase [Bacteroidales bacterium]MBP5214158.1 UDP-3-O-(3-hydroxymyristoyl)glucosamine N-acyltransferase [Bacteroidales bacterium]
MQFTAQQIAMFLHGEVIGDPNVQVSDLAKIEEGKPGRLSFLANPKYAEFLYTTESSVVLIDDKIEIDRTKTIRPTLVKVADARACMGQLLNMVEAALNPKKQGIEQPAFIAEGVQVPADAYVGAFAYLAKGVTVGEGSQIYPQVYLGENVKVGKNVKIYAGVKVYHDCVIGDNCILHAGCVIGADGFGFAPVDGQLQKISQIGNVILEGDNEVGANTTIDRATMGHTIIGRGTKLDNLVQIGHNVVTDQNNIFCAQVGVAGTTRIGAWNTFAGQVGVAGQLTIGNQNIFGAQSGIPGNIKDGNVLMGTPVIPAKDWARQAVYFKRLPDMQAELKELRKAINEK